MAMFVFLEAAFRPIGDRPERPAFSERCHCEAWFYNCWESLGVEPLAVAAHVPVEQFCSCKEVHAARIFLAGDSSLDNKTWLFNQDSRQTNRIHQSLLALT